MAEPSGDAPSSKQPKREQPAALPRPKSKPKRSKQGGRKASPLHTMQARVKRHRAARVAAEAALVGSESVEHAGSSSSPVVAARRGRAAQGPPT